MYIEGDISLLKSNISSILDFELRIACFGLNRPLKYWRRSFELVVKQSLLCLSTGQHCNTNFEQIQDNDCEQV